MNNKLEVIYVLVVATLSCVAWLVAYEIVFVDMSHDWRHALSVVVAAAVWFGVRFEHRKVWRN